jgi:hypothetical protein
MRGYLVFFLAPFAVVSACGARSSLFASGFGTGGAGPTPDGSGGAPSDAGPDSLPEDGAPDALPDVAIDAPSDAPIDALPDVATDAPACGGFMEACCKEPGQWFHCDKPFQCCFGLPGINHQPYCAAGCPSTP